MVNLVIIDLGSNSVRMKISRVDKFGSYTTVAYKREYVRLSENMGSEKTLKKEPMERTLNALKDFKAVYSKLDHVLIKSVATAAVRQAKNRDDFLEQAKKEIGLKLNVIPGKEEAYLDYVGVINTLPLRNGVIMDTGGASTELIWVQNGKCKDRISLPMGAVLLAQGYHLTDQICASNLFAAMTHAERMLMDVRWLGQVHNLPLIALGGSNRTIAKIHRREMTNNVDELPDIHGMHLPAPHIFKLVEKLVDMNKEQRATIPGLSKNRADVIVGGLIPISLVLRILQMDEVVFSNHGLRDGVLYDYLQHQK